MPPAAKPEKTDIFFCMDSIYTVPLTLLCLGAQENSMFVWVSPQFLLCSCCSSPQKPVSFFSTHIYAFVDYVAGKGRIRPCSEEEEKRKGNNKIFHLRLGENGRGGGGKTLHV
jgi:hypothetical protein